jgi:hypothetical protein
MTTATKGLIVLALFGVLGIGMALFGVNLMQRSGTPPFASGLVTMIPLLPYPPNGLVLRLAHLTWQTALWSAALLVPICAVVLFKRDRVFAALLLQVVWTLAAMFFGAWIWLFSVFHRIS